MNPLPRGVSLTPSGRYAAMMSVLNKTVHVGTYATPEIAERMIRERGPVMRAEARAKAEKAAGKRCPRCRRRKPECEFSPSTRTRDGLQCWCKLCRKVEEADRRQTEAWQAWQADYRSRPEVVERERKRLAERRSDPERRAYERSWHHAYNRSPRGNAVRNLSACRSRLRKAADPVKAERLRRLIAVYEARIARLDRLKDAELHDDEEAA